MIRQPAVAGQFYPADKKTLEQEVNKYLQVKAIPQKAIGVIAPHAGYMFSGRVAGQVYAATQVPENCIVLSPNHNGRGANVAIMSAGAWQIPFGDVPINSKLAKALQEKCSLIKEDVLAHAFEHSLEVQLPFLLAKQPKLSIVPITISRLNIEECQKLGLAIAETIKQSKQPILIVASSDLNHYENQEITKEKDQAALDKVLALDPEGLLATCATKGITMCGVIPTAIMLIAAKKLGAKNAKLIKHETSGDVCGDFSAVVGYAGIIVY
ncbi:MAG: AmmeMemoRadiSam system protein B [Pseudomonadota bacterium]